MLLHYPAAANGITAPPVETPWGTWRTPLRAEFLIRGDDKVRIRLLEPLVFVEKQGNVRVVPINFISDGASIPQFWWSLVGGPLNGKYARAAVQHDWDILCELDAPAVVHERFYCAMRADLVGYKMARTFYHIVDWRVRKWEPRADSVLNTGDA